MKHDQESLLALTHELLRAPQDIARRCREGSDLRPLAITALASLGLGGAVFGAVLGSPRGLLQAIHAAIKLPVAMLAALALCVPAFHVLAAGLHRPLALRTVSALVLAASGRAAMILLACSAPLWLLLDLGLGYHAGILCAAGCYALGGAAALGLLLRGLTASFRGAATAAAFLCVLLPVGGQTAWMLRPFFGRPAQAEIPLVRAREGSFVDAVWTSSWSALGIYTEPGEAR